MTGLLALGISVVLAGLAVVASVPVCVLLAQTLGYLAVRGRYEESTGSNGSSRPQVAVLIPAHNEALAIGGTVADLLRQLAPGDRLLVIADNCSDDTAAHARAAGAEVTERCDTMLRGKGYALDWGLSQLEASPPDVVVVIDADCTVAPGSLDRMARAAVLTGRPVQSRNLMALQDAPSLKLRVAAFAWYFKTEVRTLGWQAYGLPCQLMGTGMAFQWPLIRGVSLASGNIVEDVQLGVDLAIAGSPPVFLPQASVLSFFPADDSGAEVQRTRWEHGHLAMMVTAVPQLLREAVRQRRPVLVAVALDYCVPPLALLTVLLTLTCAANAIWWVISDASTGLVVATSAMAVLGGCVGVAWATGGRQLLSAKQLLGLPLYVIGKLPIYFRWAAGRRQKEWVRADRKDGPR